MDYTKFTKQELIDIIEKSVTLEKYNKLEESSKLKKKAIEEQEVVINTLKEQIEMQKNTYENTIRQIEGDSSNRIREIETTSKDQYRELETKANNIIQQLQSQYDSMKSHIDYSSNMLAKEYQLAMLLMKKRKEDGNIFDELVNLYHDAIFENKEEENKSQESEQ